MQYCKPHLSFEEQAELLIKRGLVADKKELIGRLKAVGYYRLSAYWYPFRQKDVEGNVLETLIPGTSLSTVWMLYRFDRDLRLLFLDAIERVEISLRCLLAYYHTEKGSPFDYTSPSYFPNWKNYMDKWEKIRRKYDSQGNLKNKKIEFLDHFFEKYGDCHEYPPLWMAVSVAELGTMAYFYDHSSKSIRKNIADEWDISSKMLSSWIHALNTLRNDCAHHARVWNKVFTKRPRIPLLGVDSRWWYVYHEKAGKWVKPHGSSQPFIQPSTSACFLFICRYLLQSVAPTSCWHERAEHLLQEFADLGVDLAQLGLPPHWEEHPLWR